MSPRRFRDSEQAHQHDWSEDEKSLRWRSEEPHDIREELKRRAAQPWTNCVCAASLRSPIQFSRPRSDSPNASTHKRKNRQLRLPVSPIFTKRIENEVGKGRAQHDASRFH